MFRSILRFKTAAAVLVAIAVTATAMHSHALDVQSDLLARIQKSYQPNFKVRDFETWKSNVALYLSTQKPDGTWADIDYTAMDSLDFSPKTHLSRAVTLAEAFATPNQSYFHNPELLTSIWRAYDHWIKNDYQSYNWWNNEIGTQQYLLKVILLTGTEISADRLAAGLKIIARTKLDQTGQNLLWRSEIVMINGLLTHQVALVENAINTIHSLIAFDNLEGLQSDGSFLQHGDLTDTIHRNLIYNGGYGDKFVQLMARFLPLLDQTPYDFTPELKQQFIDYVLKSQLFLTRNNKYDYEVLGRSITVKDKDATNLAESCLILSELAVKEKAAFSNCAASILENKVSGVQGHHSFWKSDFAVQQSIDYYASVRMYSSRTLNNDAPSNGEGLMSHHLADGALMIQKDGSEYENIFAVWDWNKVPGTTVEQKPIVAAQFIPGKPELFDQMRMMGQSNFVGSVSNGEYGASVMNFISNPKYDRLKVKKSWFFFKNAIWAMGNELTCVGCQPVLTTLNQTLSKGDAVLIDRKGVTSKLTDPTTRSDLFAVTHQDVGYLFPSAQTATVKNEIQTGDWRTINSSLKSEVVSKSVFSLTLNHGANPSAQKYEYLVIPSLKGADLSHYKIGDQFSYLNSPSIQAVYSKTQKILQVVFYQAGSFEIEKQKISVSTPCLVMIDLSGAAPVVTVSDPTQMLLKTAIVLNGVNYTAQFKTGAAAGSSVLSNRN